MMHTIFQGCAAACGSLALYVACFLYEDQEGRLQNRIEELWIAVNDARKSKGRIGIFNKLAAVVNKGIDHFLGSKLLSIQVIGVSSSYSIAGLAIGNFWFPTLFTGPPAFVWTFAAVVIFFGSLPAMYHSRTTHFLSLIPVFLLLWRFHGIVTLAAVLGSLVSDVLLILLVRTSIRRICKSDSMVTVWLEIATQLLIVEIIGLVPMTGAFSQLVFATRGSLGYLVGVSLSFLMMLNCFTVFVASIFCIVLLFFGIHRFVWPVIDKILYPVARYQIIRNHKAMAAIGIACLGAASPLVATLLRSIKEWLG